MLGLFDKLIFQMLIHGSEVSGFSKADNIERMHMKFCKHLLSDFINLTQVHNFTVSAQDIFTFRRLSVFTGSFTGILQILIR